MNQHFKKKDTHDYVQKILWNLEAEIDSADQRIHKALSTVRRLIADPNLLYEKVEGRTLEA